MRSARIVLDCGPLGAPTATTIDQLARLQLAARRRGGRLELKDAGSELVDLIGFCGLAGVLGVESRGQAEQREHPGGVQEEGELDDPPGRKFEHL
jgi:hypothetical protein